MKKYRKTKNQDWKILLVEDGSVDIDELKALTEEIENLPPDFSDAATQGKTP